MAVSAEDIKKNYPLPVYNFRVNIGSDTVSFTEISGLTIEYLTTTFKESQTVDNMAGPNIINMPSQPTDTTVVMTKGVTRGASIKALYDWISQVKTNQVTKKDVFVYLCDEVGAAVITWKIINAFPIKLDGPSFDAKSGDVAIETLALRADGITITES